MKVTNEDRFLDPQLSVDNLGLYWVKRSILSAIGRSHAEFKGTLLDIGCGQQPYRQLLISPSASVTRYIGMDLHGGAYDAPGAPRPDLCWDGKTIPLDAYFDVQPNYASNTLLAVGRHTAKKAPYLTLDAFRIAHALRPELRLCMIGDGELLEVSERLASAWGLADKVEFRGFGDRDTIVQKMESSFVFLQHSIRARSGDSDRTPVAILEAAAAGLPIISTRHAGIPEAVVDGITGFIVEPGDTRAMAEQIVLLASDHQMAKRLGVAARNHVLSNFSMEQHITRLADLLSRAAETRIKTRDSE